MRRLAALATAALVLVGCSAPLPTPEPDAVPAVAPAVTTTRQVESILDDLHAVLEEADAAGDAELLEPRVTGPAARIRTVEYVLARAGAPDAITPIPEGVQSIAVPATDSWPRTVLVVTEQPEDLSPPLLLTLVQETPREQYRLWSWARLLPGTELPAMTQPEIGSTPVPLDTDSLAMPPEDVVNRYADVLGQGDASEHAGSFAPDALRARIGETREAYTQAVGENGTLTETYAAADQGPVVLGTADGGALVVDTLRTVTTISLVDSTLTIGDQTANLLGSQTVASNLEITWLSVVVFAVPPAGSDEPVEVVGAEHSRILVSGE